MAAPKPGLVVKARVQINPNVEVKKGRFVGRVEGIGIDA
jgi:hypothetical protein